MAPETNPFRFGALAIDDAFADRDAEVAELASDIRNGQDVVVFAPRRWGKSSLAWRAAGQLASERVMVAQVDLMTTPSKESLAAALAGSIYENIASPLSGPGSGPWHRSAGCGSNRRSVSIPRTGLSPSPSSSGGRGRISTQRSSACSSCPPSSEGRVAAGPPL